MTQILLISDTPRVKQVFEALGQQESLLLRTATTLNQADQEISTAAPDFTFVQSRISGFSGEIILRHLKKTLPADANIVLLAASHEEMLQAYQQSDPYLDLTTTDETLLDCINQVLAGVYQSPEPAAPVAPVVEAVGPAEPAEAVEPKTEAVKPAEESAAEVRESATAPTEVPAVAKPEPPKVFEPLWSPEPVQPAEAQPAENQAAEAPSEDLNRVDETKDELPGSRKARTDSFAAMMDRASQKDEAAGSVPIEENERVTLRSSTREAAGGAGRREPHGSVERGMPVNVGEFTHGEPLADALRRASHKKKKPLWVPLLVLVLICVPLVSYLAGKKAAPPESILKPRSAAQSAKQPGFSGSIAAKAPAGAPAVPQGAAQPVAPKATPAQPSSAATAQNVTPGAAPIVAPGGKPEAKASSGTTAKPAPQPVAKPATPPAAPAGQKSLPSLVAQAKLDPEYGKTHPGWLRYLGASAEYKVYKEGELFKALQVLARGESIPDQLFKTALREFGGGDAYRVESTGEKGKYLVEQGDSKGGVALTVYRSKGDRRMKGFVLYYR